MFNMKHQDAQEKNEIQFLAFRDTHASKFCGALSSVSSGNRIDSGRKVVCFEGRGTFAQRMYPSFETGNSKIFPIFQEPRPTSSLMRTGSPTRGFWCVWTRGFFKSVWNLSRRLNKYSSRQIFQNSFRMFTPFVQDSNSFLAVDFEPISVGSNFSAVEGVPLFEFGKMKWFGVSVNLDPISSDT